MSILEIELRVFFNFTRNYEKVLRIPWVTVTSLLLSLSD